MKFLSVALAVLASASLAGAQKKYLCPANQTDATITVNNKAKLQFLVAKKTAHNMDCTANYVMGTCSRVKLACKFKLNGRGKACSGDQALVTANGKTTTLCKGKKGKYSANVNGDFSIKVVTDGEKTLQRWKMHNPLHQESQANNNDSSPNTSTNHRVNSSTHHHCQRPLCELHHHGEQSL